MNYGATIIMQKKIFCGMKYEDFKFEENESNWIGEGSFSQVFKVLHLPSNKYFALKKISISGDEDFEEQF